MNILGFLFRRFKKPDKLRKSFGGEGMLIFENTSEVIKVEKVLRSSGYSVKVMGPPPEFRKGCDLVIVFPILMQPDVTRCLKKNGIEPL